MSVGLATFLSRRWIEASGTGSDTTGAEAVVSNIGLDRLRPARTAWASLGIAYLQLVIGANLRHPGVNLSPFAFRGILFGHLVLAAVLTFYACWLVRSVKKRDGWVWRPAVTLVALIGCQLALGFGTWVTKHAWPGWADFLPGAVSYVVTAQSFQQAVIVTGHVAVGSLILVTSLLVALRSTRLLTCRATTLVSKMPVEALA